MPLSKFGAITKFIRYTHGLRIVKIRNKIKLISLVQFNCLLGESMVKCTIQLPLQSTCQVNKK